jgi:hypothetical protein
MKVVRLPVTRLSDVQVTRELMRRYHWRRWFETKDRKHLLLARSIQTRS